jgi:pyridoxamine 5'-phosphate oxidase
LLALALRHLQDKPVNMSIAAIRKDYRLRSLTESDVSKDPISQFNSWFQEAVKAEIDEVNAMTLATASAEGVPSARIVLLKGFDNNGFVFFTNYNSHKGKDVEENPRACLVFFWKELERQVRITGLVAKTSAAESDAYFNSRPEGSRIGALASPQSEVIESREWLESREADLRAKTAGIEVQRPQHWGGYRVKPVTVEFWQGRSNRLHDRIRYTFTDAGVWLVERLAP